MVASWKKNEKSCKTCLGKIREKVMWIIRLELTTEYDF